jgi:4-hydroxybenzoate polyprenyltransferase
MTNTTKALIISAINSALGLAIAFGVNITEVQTGAIIVFANAFGALVVGLTYKSSAKRIPNGGAVLTLDPNQED